MLPFPQGELKRDEGGEEENYLVNEIDSSLPKT